MTKTAWERMTRADALFGAEQFVELIRPWCHRVEIAGSIRRNEPTAGDIEIVCEPKRTPSLDIFGDVTGWIDELHDIDSLIQVARRSDSAGRPCWGDRHKKLWFYDSDGLDMWPIDLFSVLPPAQYGVIQMIRTGPADFSKRMVTPKRFGGYMPDFLRVQDGQVFDGVSGSALATQDERKLFALWNMSYIEPERRR